MRIRWTPAAAADLQHISDYLKDHHPHRISNHSNLEETDVDVLLAIFANNVTMGAAVTPNRQERRHAYPQR
jgi:plasmid stabilization system protein ParE